MAYSLIEQDRLRRKIRIHKDRKRVVFVEGERLMRSQSAKIGVSNLCAKSGIWFAEPLDSTYIHGALEAFGSGGL